MKPARNKWPVPNPSRGGYTLLELLLVLTVLVVLASIAWPSVEGLYERNQLQSAAEDVRNQLSQARLAAIDSGLIYAFRYQVGGRDYTAAPAEPAVSSSGQPDGAALSGQLPEQMQFRQPEAETFSAAGTSTLETLSQAIGEMGTDSAGYSPPILFFPDGSALDAVFEVVDSEQRTVEISVRGLTGSIRVGDVHRRPPR